MDKATPRPWIYNKETGQILGDSDRYIPICQFWSKSEEDYLNSKTNARLIIKSVNCHDELVDALKEMMRQCEYPQASEFNKDGRMIRMPNLEKAKQALSNATQTRKK